MNYCVEIKIKADVVVPESQIKSQNDIECYIENMVNEMADHHGHDSGFCPVDVAYKLTGEYDSIEKEMKATAISW